MSKHKKQNGNEFLFDRKSPQQKCQETFEKLATDYKEYLRVHGKTWMKDNEKRS